MTSSHPPRISSLGGAALLVLGAAAAPAPAQVSGLGSPPIWLPAFGEQPGISTGTIGVLAQAVFDDGGGPALYLAGGLTHAGSTPVNRIVRWDGAGWSPLGAGVNGVIRALAVFDDGSGPALYAAGDFTQAGGQPAAHVARWDGASWSPLGTGIGGAVYALQVYDGGAGPELCAGGIFTTAGGVPANYVARWDGSSWSPLGPGVSGSPGQIYVQALGVCTLGGQERLYAGGRFLSAGGVAVSNVASWDGSTWAALGAGITGVPVEAFAAFDDGGGEALYAAGDFASAGGATMNRIARWNGATWSALGSGLNDDVNALQVFDDGGGAALYAGGRFTASGATAVEGIARWDGQAWSPVGGGIDISAGTVASLTVHDDGSGPVLFAGGAFGWAGDVFAHSIAGWDGSAWSALGAGLNAEVRCLAIFDDGGGEALYAGGRFITAGGVATTKIGRWDGASWSSLGGGLTSSIAAVDGSMALALAEFDDGGGTALYAGGSFQFAGGVPSKWIARWDGSSWSPLGGGLASSGPFEFGRVSALAVFDDGGVPALFVGGEFSSAGGAPASNIARWDGTSWSPLGSGADPASSEVSALAVFDDGSGPALYAGGSFKVAGGVPAPGIAMWDGAAWSPLGGGLNGHVLALAVHDDGSGPALYAGGGFYVAGGSEGESVARWDGSSWTALSGGADFHGHVRALAAFDDGAGQQLYAAGWFDTIGGATMNHVARWDGNGWSALGSGVELTPGAYDPGVQALAVFDDGTGPALFAGGDFLKAFDTGDSYLAKWGRPVGTSVPGCFGNPAGLSALASAAQVGKTLPLELQASGFDSGTAFVFAGLDGTDPSGCGVLVPGIGELLLAFGPGPFLIAQSAVAGGVAACPVHVPANPSLVGANILLHAVHVGPPPAVPIELSNGLAVQLE